MAEEASTWIRKDESDLAEELIARNLAHANEIQDLVHPRQSLYVRYVKRLLDIVISGVALVVFLPINAVLAIVTLKDVGRPILYKQARAGLNGRPFVLVKFRNMTNERDENGELLPPSQRVTKRGKVIRKYSLDELLNFWSVFKGDMSIIGPRPLPVQYCERLSDRHFQRHEVRPGLLCPIRNEIKEQYPYPEPFSTYQAQFESEVWYVENVSFATDVKMLGLLFKAAFDMKQRGRNAQSASPFIGYDKEGYAVSRKYFEESARKDETK